MGKRFRKIDSDFREFLESYAWPGNVRELENLIERAVILADSDTLTCKDLPEAAPPPQLRPPAEINGRPVSIEEYMRGVVERYQEAHSDTELARMLGIGRKALWMRRRRWGLKREGGAKA